MTRENAYFLEALVLAFSLSLIRPRHFPLSSLSRFLPLLLGVSYDSFIMSERLK